MLKVLSKLIIFFYSPTTEVMNVVKLCKLKDMKLVWKAIFKILKEQGGLEIDSNGVLNLSQAAKKEKKAKERQKVDSEKDYLEANAKGSDSQVMYYMMFLVDIGRVRQIETVEDCQADYIEFLKEQMDQGDADEKIEEVDDDDNKYDHIINDKRKVDQRNYNETSKHFKMNVSKGPKGLKVLDQKGGDYEVPRPVGSTVSVEDFMGYLKTTNLTGVACLFKDKDFF